MLLASPIAVFIIGKLVPVADAVEEKAGQFS